jgi:hypothetical protein
MWHLLSLDAPTVAVVWTWFTARVTGTAVPWTTYAAMGLAVWMLYAGDRLLDSRGGVGLEERHRFHGRNRVWFLVGIGAASVGLAGLLPLLTASSLRLYLAEGALMAGYFLLIHAGPVGLRVPKELIVGPFFAAATFIPTVARAPWLRSELWPDAVLFGVLCSLNGLFIRRWEHGDGAAPWGMGWAVRGVERIAWGVVGVGVGMGFWFGVYPLACAGAAGLLLGLERVRGGGSRVGLRAAADAVLLTPLVVIPWLR